MGSCIPLDALKFAQQLWRIFSLNFLFKSQSPHCQSSTHVHCGHSTNAAMFAAGIRVHAAAHATSGLSTLFTMVLGSVFYVLRGHGAFFPNRLDSICSLSAHFLKPVLVLNWATVNFVLLLPGCCSVTLYSGLVGFVVFHFFFEELSTDNSLGSFFTFFLTQKCNKKSGQRCTAVRPAALIIISTTVLQHQ